MLGVPTAYRQLVEPVLHSQPASSLVDAIRQIAGETSDRAPEHA
ncbi:hypothetical protein SPICUR_00860 [Spiribacter curvatus]|uniref:Uncharacterized protein n=1 Tax=Spiribacter curvatus TaxID=1335757 RepID=U5T4X7_9GAMM|nr:hypothetical protein SPICUR_00860 [Spiribacter curvatus]